MATNIEALSAQLDALSDEYVFAIADATLDDWRELLPEVDRGRLARVLLVVHAKTGFHARRWVEGRIREVQ